MTSPDYLIQCRKSGLFFSDLYTEAVVLSKLRTEAMRFTDQQTAQRAIEKALKPFYPSFHWQAVEA